MVSVECPHCGFCKSMPADKLPQQETNLKCPKCSNTFSFDPIVASLVASDDEPATSPPLTSKDPETPSVGHEPAAEQIPLEAPPAKPRRTEMMRIGELFSASWQSFKSRIWTLLGISLLGVLLVLIAFFLMQSGMNLLMGLFGGSMLGPLLSVLVMGSFMFLAVTWVAAATVYAVVDGTGVKASLGLGLNRVWAFLWLFSLVGLIVGGGFGLLIIPGILFTVWFSFAQYVLAAEDTRGMEALLKSKEYVRGHGWGVFGRLLLLMLIFIPISLIPIVGPLLSMLLGPFTMIYYNEIYQDLREMKPDITYPVSSGQKSLWITLGIVGFLAMPVFTYFTAGPEFRQAISMMGSMSGSGFSLQMDEEEMARELERQMQLQLQQNNQVTDRKAQPAANNDPLQDLMVYVYSLNYKGKINLNGKDFYVIKGTPDMNYNYSTGGALQYGKNIFKVDYSSLPNPWKVELRIKVYKPNWETGERTVFKEWVLEDQGGSKTFEIEISPEQT